MARDGARRTHAGLRLGVAPSRSRPRGAQSGAVNVVWGPRRAAAPVVCTRAVGELGRVESSRVRTLPRQCVCSHACMFVRGGYKH